MPTTSDVRFLAKLRASRATGAFAGNRMSEAISRENVRGKCGPKVKDAPEGATQGKRE